MLVLVRGFLSKIIDGLKKSLYGPYSSHFNGGISITTYNKIQEWVKMNYGFTVKTCWIAHTKEISGLNPRKAHNRYDEFRRTNPCPLDKVEPIQQAFRYFKMI